MLGRPALIELCRAFDLPAKSTLRHMFEIRNPSIELGSCKVVKRVNVTLGKLTCEDVNVFLPLLRSEVQRMLHRAGLMRFSGPV